MKRSRWGSYDDYAKEIDEEAERKAHVEQQCDPAYCIYCQTDKELDKPGAGVDVNGKTLTGELAQPHTRAEEKRKIEDEAYLAGDGAGPRTRMKRWANEK